MNRIQPVVGIIVPSYNEEAVLADSADKLANELRTLVKERLISASSFIAFVDDGSTDETWDVVSDLASKDPVFKGLKLAGNVGHQRALLAGLVTYTAAVDCLISIDADLQDDIAVIPDMLTRYKEGFEVVYGVRSERKVDSFAKRFSAESYYKLLRFFGVKVVYNHADFRLIGRQALEALSGFKEINLFLRGLVPLIGFKSTTVGYRRKERKLGGTKYPLYKMLALAFDGITSFSTMPLRVITIAGFTIFILSLCMGVYVVVGYLSMRVVSGWASTVLPLYLLGGIQLLAVGVIGEYLAKIYAEVKGRPRFIIDKQI